MSFKEFASLLLALGTKLPAVWKQLLAIYAAVQALYLMATPQQMLADKQSIEPTPLVDDAVDSELEAKLVQVLAKDDQMFDGTIIKKLYAFVVAHPELATTLFKLISKASVVG